MQFIGLSVGAQAGTCNKHDISYVQSYQDHSKPERGTFKYYYQYKKKANSSIPTVIVIPGGPGGTSMDLLPENPYFDFTQIQFGFAEKYNAILTDPRSVGCNSDGENLLAGTFSSDNVVGDIVEIIRSLKLDNYILYGHSYGTVVATMVASRLQQSHLPAPKAVVLSSTLGRYFENHSQEVIPAYYKAWNNLYRYLPERVKSYFPQEGDWSHWEKVMDQKTIVGLPAQAMFDFIFNNLNEGALYQNGVMKNVLLDKLRLLDGHDADALVKLKSEIMEQPKVGSQAEVKPFHDTIWCRELEKAQASQCKVLNLSFDKPFDSKFYQIVKAPIVYIHGEFDPSAPLSQGEYHFRHQRNENKVFLIARDGGHATTAAIADCKEDFWKALAHQGDIKSAVNKCSGITVKHL